MADPEETEREALAKLIGAGVCTKCYGLGTRFGPGIPCYHCQGTGRKLLKADAVIDAILAARRLSESEIRREWGVLTQGNDDHETFWCSTEDNARAIMHDGDTLMSRSAAVPAGEWTREEK